MSSTTFGAVTIDVEGCAELIGWDTAGRTLRHLQEAVGGLVDVVAPGLDMWVNDDGIGEGLPAGAVATYIAHSFGSHPPALLGPAVLTGGADAEGETLSLTSAQADALFDMARLARASV